MDKIEKCDRDFAHDLMCSNEGDSTQNVQSSGMINV